jgi:hypothetical protein
VPIPRAPSYSEASPAGGVNCRSAQSGGLWPGRGWAGLAALRPTAQPRRFTRHGKPRPVHPRRCPTLAATQCSPPAKPRHRPNLATGQTSPPAKPRHWPNLATGQGSPLPAARNPAQPTAQPGETRTSESRSAGHGTAGMPASGANQGDPNQEDPNQRTELGRTNQGEKADSDSGRKRGAAGKSRKRTTP